MDEEAKFKDNILKGAKLHLALYSERFDLEIELIDVSIDKETLEIVDDEIINKLVPATELDVKPDTQLYIEPTIKVIGRNVISPIILHVTKEGDIELEDSKVEEVTITSKEETEFAERWPLIKRVLDAVIVWLIVEAIKFGIRLALELLR